MFSFSYNVRHNRRNGDARFIGPIFLGLGIIFGITAAILAIVDHYYMVGTVQASGRIISCSYVDDSSACRPTVSFTTAAGRELTFTSASSSSSFKQGDMVSVRYDPNNPGNASVSTFFVLGFLSLLFGLFFVVFGGVGLFLTLFLRRLSAQRMQQPMSETYRRL